MSHWLPQTGVGIELSNGNLYACCVRRVWGRTRVLDTLELPAYCDVGAAECGRRYREFLQRNGLQAPWTVVALPRSQVLVRPLRFPSAMEKELARAVELQLDALHPFEPDAVVWDFAPAIQPDRRLLSFLQKPASQSSSLDVIVGIAEKRVVDELTEWFQEAGIPVSQFTLSTSLLLTAFRAGGPSERTGTPLFVLHMREDGCELVAHAAGRPVMSREITDGVASDENAEATVIRELSLARSELRLQPDEAATLVLRGVDRNLESALRDAGLAFHIMPASSALPTTGSEEEHCVALAAATAAAERGPSLPLNLLTVEKRSYQSPLAHAPTYALGCIVVLLAVALGLRSSVQDFMYSRHLAREQAALRPQIEELEKLQGTSRASYERLATLAGFRQSAGLPLELLDELTRALPPDAWLQHLQYDGATVTLSGTAQSASAVLQALSASSHLEAPQFSASLTRTPEGKEVFRIGARLRAANQ